MEPCTETTRVWEDIHGKAHMLVLGILPWKATAQHLPGTDLDDDAQQPPKKQKIHIGGHRTRPPDVLDGRIGRDVQRVGSLLNYFGVTRNDLQGSNPEDKKRIQSIPLLFCSLDGEKGQGEERTDVIFDLCVGQKGCNFNEGRKYEPQGEYEGDRRTRSTTDGFVANVTKSVAERGKPLTHILDEWCWIPIGWADGQDRSGNKWYHDPNKFDNIIQLAEGGQLASGCKVMIPTHNNALELVFGDTKIVTRMQEAGFDVELLFSDAVTTENNPLWDFAVNIDNNDPLWHDRKEDGKEATIKGGVENISRHYRDHCSKYGPWVHAIENGHDLAKKWNTDIWDTMDQYCVGKPLGGLKHLHTTAKKLGDLGAGMHPVMIEFTYVPKVERRILKLPKTTVILNFPKETLCMQCQDVYDNTQHDTHTTATAAGAPHSVN